MRKLVVRIGLLLIVFMLISQPIMASDLGTEASFGNRMRVFPKLRGLVADKPTDIQLNPAFWAQIEDRELFTDFYLQSIPEGSSKLDFASQLGYRLSKSNVLGGKFAVDSDSGDYIFKLGDALQINENLSLGGRTGVENIAEKLQVTLAAGANYQITDNLAFDGTIGVKDEEMELFMRGKKQLQSTGSVVGAVDLAQGFAYKRLAVAKNEQRKDSLWVYGGEVVDRQAATAVNLIWGAELKFNRKLTGRAGGQHNLFYKSEEATEVKIPHLNFINVGVSYKIDESTTIDLASTPVLQFGENAKLILSFTLQQQF